MKMALVVTSARMHVAAIFRVDHHLGGRVGRAATCMPALYLTMLPIRVTDGPDPVREAARSADGRVGSVPDYGSHGFHGYRIGRATWVGPIRLFRAIRGEEPPARAGLLVPQNPDRHDLLF